jgi:hypothetical protein
VCRSSIGPASSWLRPSQPGCDFVQCDVVILVLAGCDGADRACPISGLPVQVSPTSCQPPNTYVARFTALPP